MTTSQQQGQDPANRARARFASTPEWQLGVAMGERHASTGDPADFSDQRCLPLEAELDAEAKRLGPDYPFGHPAFRAGYEHGYERAVAAAGWSR